MCECCGGDCRLCGNLMQKTTPLALPIPKDESIVRKVKKHKDKILDILKCKSDFASPLCSNIISRIEDIGRAQERLKIILNDEIFEQLSKHNPYWRSENEAESNKLSDIRFKISLLQDNLWDLWAIIRKEEEI